MNRFFQALLSRFLGEHLEGYELENERTLRGMFTFDPAHNPRSAESPSLRPDFLVLRKQRIQAVLDAKYRDLWRKDLPREMLYQLALYALGQSGPESRAAILYPTLESEAREQIILVNDPLRGTAKAQVILRPVNLLKLDLLLGAKGVQAQRSRAEFAQRLAFGTPPNDSNN
jgi:5-methylcytosine-specific restriction enzyme subunit McrC